MPGGYIQLAAYGSQDYYLTSNPQISFFKTVYRRYTNFSMDFYRVNPENNLTLSDKNTTTYKFKIDRNADLISNIFFVFLIPDIYSSENTEFKWIPNLGFNIIESVSFFIGGSKIDEQYGEWMYIWSEMTMVESKKKNFYEMVGNTWDLYNPKRDSGNGNVYPNKTVNDFIPSIFGRKIRVPLYFWFSTNPSLAVPLVALQYHPVEISIILRKINDLFTIIDREVGSTTAAKRIKTNPNINSEVYDRRYGIHNFIKDPTFVDSINGERVLKSFPIDPYLDINYIYLSMDEMKRFAQTEHKYLINQVKKSSFKEQIGSITLDLLIHHPTTLLVVIVKRSDMEDFNKWNNFTNWIDRFTAPYKPGFFNEYFDNNLSNSNELSEVANESNIDIRKNKDCIKSISLKLNGVERFAAQEGDFFNKCQSFLFCKGQPPDGVYPYSFSLDPFKYQPSGSCNMSRFSSIQLEMETQNVPIDPATGEYKYKFDINVYSMNYNILRIISGQGNVEFSN